MDKNRAQASLDKLMGELSDAIRTIEKVDEPDLIKLFDLTGISIKEFASEVVSSPKEEQTALISMLVRYSAVPYDVRQELKNWTDLDMRTRTEVIERSYRAILKKESRVKPRKLGMDAKEKAERELELYRMRRTNALYRAVDMGIDRAFDALHDNIEVGEECLWYVVNRSTDNGDLKDVSLEAKLYQELKSWNRAIQKHVVLVHGSTGHGKTSFVNYFYRSYLPKVFREEANRTIFIRVHVSSASEVENFEEDVDHQISDELVRQQPDLLLKRENVIKIWETIYPFDNDFQKMLVQSKYPFKEPEEARLRWIDSRYSTRPQDRRSVTRHSDWNRARINFLVSKGFRVVLFFDNADQAPSSTQMAAFRMARHKLEWLPIKSSTAIVAVRDYMVERALQQLDLQSFEVQRFHVPPPVLAEVVEKRAKIAAKFCEKEYGRPEFTIVFESAKLPRFSFTVTDVENFFLGVFRSFENPQIRPFLYQIANQNYRVVLGMIHMVLSSPLIKDENIMDFLHEYKRIESKYVRMQDVKPLLRPHEVLYCLLASDPTQHFFSKYESPLLNLYDVGEDSHPGNSLIQLHLLEICRNRTWVSPVNLKRYLEALGYYEEMVNVTVDRLFGARLLYSKEGIQLSDKLFHIEKTPASLSYIDDVIWRLFYLQLVAHDISNMPEDLKRRLPETQAAKDPRSDLITRIRSAAILYHHIKNSEAELETRTVDRNLREYLNLESISTRLYDRIMQESAKVLRGEPDKFEVLKSWMKDYRSIPS